jgi:hypothetical protein
MDARAQDANPQSGSARKVHLTPPEPKARPDAEYVTSGGAELVITEHNGLFTIHFYRGGQLPASLEGSFTSRLYAHRAVVSYLQSDNVRGTAKWPQ